MLFGKKKFGSQNAPEFLIAGLGNPGLQYENTRHNAGFLALEALAKSCDIRVDRMKFQGLYGLGDIADRRCLLLQPQTFMNNSGQSIGAFADFYHIPPEKVIVFMDDISLEPGLLRIRRKGTHGGHNGARDICAVLGSDNWQRVKIGVGAKPNPDYDLAAWVLSKFTDKEFDALTGALDRAAKAAILMVQDKTDEAMNRYNS